MPLVSIDVEARAEHLNLTGERLNHERPAGVTADIEQRLARKPYLPGISCEKRRIFDLGPRIEPHIGTVLQREIDALSFGRSHAGHKIRPAPLLIGNISPTDADGQYNDGRRLYGIPRYTAPIQQTAARGLFLRSEQQQCIVHSAFAVEDTPVFLIGIEPLHQTPLFVGGGFAFIKTI